MCRRQVLLRDGVRKWVFVALPLAVVWAFPVLFGSWSRGFYPFLIFVLFTPLFVFLHEVGHAIAGALTGFRIETIKIGHGLFFAAHKWLGIRWEIHVLPYSGACYGFPKKEPATRWQWTAYELGGPLVNLVFLGIGIVLATNPSLKSSPFSEELYIPWILILCNSLILLITLIPFSSMVGEHRIPNDCLIILEMWSRAETFGRSKPAESRRGHDSGGPDATRIWAFRIFGACGVLAAVPTFLWTAESTDFRWLPAIPLMAGTLLFIDSFRQRLPRLSKISRSNPDGIWKKVSDRYQADRERLLDGLPDLSALDESWRAVRTELNRGNKAMAAVPLATLLQKHPQCLALLDLQAYVLNFVGKIDSCLAHYDRALALPDISEFSKAVLESWRFMILVFAGRTADAIASAQRALDRTILPPVRFVLLVQLTRITLESRCEEYLPYADAWSAEAVSINPLPFARTTRAGVLHELKRDDEAQPMLSQLVTENLEGSDRGLAYLYLALIANRRGEMKHAHQFSWAAFRSHPEYRLVVRLADAGLASV